MIITTIIIFFLVLGLIVLFHEAGHFLAARYFGVKVEEFGLGFPPRAKKLFKKGDTEYTLNWLPIGGFCKIMGEDGEDKNNPESFASRGVGQRALILSAGVIMNIILAALLFSLIFMVGMPTDITGGIDKSKIGSFKDQKVQISAVAENSPAAEAGIMMGDAVYKIDETEIVSIEELQNYVDGRRGEEVSVYLLRGKEEVTKKITPRENPPENEGSLGISLAETALVSYPVHQAIWKGIVYTGEITIFIITAFAGIIWSLLTVGKAGVEVSGPVGIAVLTGQVSAMGLIYLLNFTALISVNLAIINALPFPALDGGRLLFLAVEKIKGSPVNQNFEAKVNNYGFMLLMFLMLVVTFYDVGKYGIWDKITGLFG